MPMSKGDSVKILSKGQDDGSQTQPGVRSALFTEIHSAKPTRGVHATEYPSIRPGTSGVSEANFSDIQAQLADKIRQEIERGERVIPPSTEELKLREERRRLDAQNELEQTAYQRGKTESTQEFAVTKSELQQNFDEQLKEISETVQRLSEAVRNFEHQANADALDLAIQIAEKVIRKKLTADREAMVASVLEVLTQADGPAPLHITCAPNVAEQIKLSMSHGMRSMGIEEWVVQENADLESGDLLISQGPMTLDARLETRLERIRRALLRELKLENPKEGGS